MREFARFLWAAWLGVVDALLRIAVLVVDALLRIAVLVVEWMLDRMPLWVQFHVLVEFPFALAWLLVASALHVVRLLRESMPWTRRQLSLLSTMRAVSSALERDDALALTFFDGTTARIPLSSIRAAEAWDWGDGLLESAIVCGFTLDVDGRRERVGLVGLAWPSTCPVAPVETVRRLLVERRLLERTRFWPAFSLEWKAAVRRCAWLE